MPRKPRDDLRPRILLPNVLDQQARADRAIGTHYRAKVRRIGDKPPDSYMVLYDDLERTLSVLRAKGVKLDVGLLHFMINKCEMAKVIIADDLEDHFMITHHNMLVCELVKVGCRMYMKQGEIAKEFGCSLGHVNEQIKLMRDAGLIVNQGHGWYEFGATLCWRGDADANSAYREVQRNIVALRRSRDKGEVSDD